MTRLAMSKIPRNNDTNNAPSYDSSDEGSHQQSAAHPVSRQGVASANERRPRITGNRVDVLITHSVTPQTIHLAARPPHRSTQASSASYLTCSPRRRSTTAHGVTRIVLPYKSCIPGSSTNIEPGRRCTYRSRMGRRVWPPAWRVPNVDNLLSVHIPEWCFGSSNHRSQSHCWCRHPIVSK